MKIFCWAASLLIAGAVSPTTHAAKVPTTAPNWRLELLAAAPAIKHPSVLCAAPDGRIFVAEDPMDITAPANAALGRILCLHPGGRWTVFATNLHAVFGLQYLEGKLFVLHNPRFTRFTDQDGVGVDRFDLIDQTNPNPWALDWNDHVPANFRLAMDGYFYVAIGDKGLYQCRGPDGSLVNLHGGGIVRLRPDATGLEVFSTGTRNILDVALNSEDELFTYDNTDEHQWMGRLTHMVDGGFYGYPYDFIPQRPYTLWMIHDFGAGAACGAVAYTEDALPPEYRDNLFLADFGKRQVTRVSLDRDGASFRMTRQEELFRDQPEDFRPVGIAFAPDGLSLYICDWQHRDVKENDASVGRVWKLTWTGASHGSPKPLWHLPLALGRSTNVPAADLIAALSHPSRAVRITAQRALAASARSRPASLSQSLVALLRDVSAPVMARWHALWALDLMSEGHTPVDAVMGAAKDRDRSVARQAIRLIGYRRLVSALPLLSEQLKDPDASVRFQAATALGRIADPRAVRVLLAALDEQDLFARYAAFTALNRIGRAQPAAWPAIVAGLESTNARIREASGFAVRETFSEPLVAALAAIAGDGARSGHARLAALAALAALLHQPPEWHGEWWAYHPAKAPPPERTRAWSGTTPILETLRAALAESDADLRLIAARGLGEARDSSAAPRLRQLLMSDPNGAVRRAALNSLARLKDSETAPLLASLVRNAESDPDLRAEGVRLAREFGGPLMAAALIDLLARPAQAADLRITAIDALGSFGGADASVALRRALGSVTVPERRAAIRALAQRRDPGSVPDLLTAWQSPETRPDALAALCRTPDPRALEAYLEGLSSADPAVREPSRQALAPMRLEVFSRIESRAGSLSAAALAELRRLYQNDPELLQRPLFAGAAKAPEVEEYERYASAHSGDPAKGQGIFFNEKGVACIRCHAISGQGGNVGPDLTLAGAQFSRAQLIESVLYPSRAVREGYQQIVVDVKGEDAISGALKADTADGLTLVDAAGRTNFVPRASIVNRRTSELSLMPDGLQVGLTLDEFADLIGYLESLRGGRGDKSGEK